MKGVNPPATNLPNHGQETLSFPLTISTENVIVFSDQRSVFMAWCKRSANICLRAMGQGKEKKAEPVK